MAGAHGDALFGQQVSQVGMVHSIDHKAGQRDSRRTEQAQALALLQPSDQLAMQGCFVGVYGAGVEAAQVIQAGAEGDHRGNRRSASLKTQWCWAKAGVAVVGVQQHLATKLPVRQLLKGVRAAIKKADAVRAVEFVARAYIEVAAQGLHVLATD